MAEVFLKLLQSFIQKKSGEIDALYESGKGFEGWFQAELFLYLLNELGDDFEILREKEYVNENGETLGLFCDLYIENETSAIWIELKVDNNNSINMGEKFLEDIDKLSYIGYGEGLAILVSKKTYSESLSSLEIIPVDSFYIIADYMIAE